MDFTAAQYTQLIVALLAGVILFALAYVASEKSVVAVLLVSLPFQPITSSFGSVNTVLIFMVSAVWLLRGRMKQLPLLGAFTFIFFACLLALSQANRATYADHVFYVIGLVGNILLFYLVYNFFRKPENDPRSAMLIFTAVGIAATLFSVAKFFVGFDNIVVFGIQELEIGENLERQSRLIGPFNAAGVNGAFYGTQILLSLFFMLHTRSMLFRVVLLGMVFANSALLVATGSRGSFVVAAFGFLLFLILFLRQIGAGRALLLGSAGLVVAALGAVVVIQFTEFDVLFERLTDTEFEGFVPDTRQVAFEYALERIPEAMVFGHGPRLRLMNEAERRIPGHQPLPFAHNLYLHLLLTQGIVGLLAYLSWFLILITRLIKGMRRRGGDAFTSGLARLGLLVTVVFLIDELKIEFLRFQFFDYQNYMFALFATFLAFADKAARATPSAARGNARTAAAAARVAAPRAHPA